MRRVFSAYDRKEGFLESERNRPRLAGPDLAIVDLANRSQFGGGPGDKDFVGDIHFIPREPFLRHVNLEDWLLDQSVP